MAVDKKSQHVGNHGGAYTDNDGMSRQFTYIDHDKKPTKSFCVETADAASKVQEYRKLVISQILTYPASLCPSNYMDFTVRGDTTSVTWNVTMVSDPGLSLERLMSIKTLIENIAEIHGINLEG